MGVPVVSPATTEEETVRALEQEGQTGIVRLDFILEEAEFT